MKELEINQNIEFMTCPRGASQLTMPSSPASHCSPKCLLGSGARMTRIECGVWKFSRLQADTSSSSSTLWTRYHEYLLITRLGFLSDISVKIRSSSSGTTNPAFDESVSHLKQIETEFSLYRWRISSRHSMFATQVGRIGFQL
jgi:hypothetical protein